jgi:hypothetical protein
LVRKVNSLQTVNGPPSLFRRGHNLAFDLPRDVQEDLQRLLVHSIAARPSRLFLSHYRTSGTPGADRHTEILDCKSHNASGTAFLSQSGFITRMSASRPAKHWESPTASKNVFNAASQCLGNSLGGGDGDGDRSRVFLTEGRRDEETWAGSWYC